MSESYEEAIIRLEAEIVALGLIIDLSPLTNEHTCRIVQAVLDGATATTTEAREPKDG